MSYIQTSGWGADLQSTAMNVFGAKPVSFAQEQAAKFSAKGREIISSVQKTAASAQKAVANAEKTAAAGSQAVDQWKKAKPFVLVGGIILIALVVKKLV